jgi:predicted DNA-binding ribbon-helix-helix protein
MKSPKRPKSPVVKRSIEIVGHQTSISLEDQFWEALKQIAKERGTTLKDLVASIEAEPHTGGLSSAIRVFVIEHYEARLPGA